MFRHLSVRRSSRSDRAPAVVVLVCALALACAAEPEPAAESEDDLTSSTALARTVTFTGVVYVENASDWAILDAAKKQTRSAFGAFREATVAVNERELAAVDASKFVKTAMDVLDPTGKVVKKVTRVQYTYTDTAVMPKSFASRSSLSLGLLHGSYASQSARILKECTTNDKHAQEMQGEIWYVFNPSLTSCKNAMAAEQQAIDADRAKLTSATTQVPLSEANRLYVPMTARFSGKKTNSGKSYPEYDRLWAGGVAKGRLVMASVNGMLADWHAGSSNELIDDEGFHEWYMQLRPVFQARAGWKLASVEPAEDVLSYTVGGKAVKATDFFNLLQWELDGTGWPAGVTTSAHKRELRVAVGKKLYQKWLRFELPLKVKIGSAAEQSVILTYDTYFGAGGSGVPHKRAIKNSDIYVYNGHSYIGYGPLDPGNFSNADFPSSYQVFFIDSCVSYNYYEKDFFKLKSGGSQNLDLITNGLETWTSGSGEALGKWLAAITGSKFPSWLDLLVVAQIPYAYSFGGDALRVVDGELDNKWTPAKPISIK